MAADDERIVEYFRSVSQGRQRERNRGPINLESPEIKEIDAREFINSVELQFWNRLAKLSWMPFEEAREFVQGLELQNQIEWNHYCKGKLKTRKPDDIPYTPQKVESTF